MKYLGPVLEDEVIWIRNILILGNIHYLCYDIYNILVQFHILFLFNEEDRYALPVFWISLLKPFFGWLSFNNGPVLKNMVDSVTTWRAKINYCWKNGLSCIAIIAKYSKTLRLFIHIFYITLVFWITQFQFCLIWTTWSVCEMEELSKFHSLTYKIFIYSKICIPIKMCEPL